MMRFDTKIAVVLREDLPIWQRLNMTAFLCSGIAATVEGIVGEPYQDASEQLYLPMFRQPVLVFRATADELRKAYARAHARDLRIAIFTDDLSMGGAAEFGDIVARANAALSAGCDVLPVCNDRASVAKLLDGLEFEVEPAAHLRLVRMRGRAAPDREELFAGGAWRSASDLLARSAAAPKLSLTAGNA